MRWKMVRHTLWAIIFIASLLPNLGGEQNSQRLELQGQILVEPPEKQEHPRASVQLSGSTEPYAAHTWSDGKGRFKFRNLAPGTYNLGVAFPKGIETRQSVEVTPSFAHGGGIVSITITVERAGVSLKTSTGDTVSVRELAIPDNAYKEYSRAQEQLQKHNLPEAIRHLERSVEMAPRFVEALNQLGTISYQTRDYEQAEKYFRQALAQNPKAFPPLVNLGGALFALKRFDEALRINQRAVAARPDEALANSQLGFCYIVLGKYVEARQYLTKAKTLDPNHFTHPQLYLAGIDERQGLKQEAVEELKDFLARHPDSPSADEVRKKILALQPQN